MEPQCEAADRSVNKFKSQELVNMAWAFATAGCLYAPLFAELVTAMEQCVDRFAPQDFIHTAWALAVAGELAPSLLDPISSLMRRLPSSIKVCVCWSSSANVTCLPSVSACCSYSVLSSIFCFSWVQRDWKIQHMIYSPCIIHKIQSLHLGKL